jgi:anti-sigma B factor antagonist
MLDHTHGWNRLVLDLSGVPALDSAALGPLVQKLREVQEANGRLVLTGVEAPALREIFALTRFDRVFPIVPDRAAAIAQAAS